MLRSLEEDPRRASVDIARELGLSSRTVQRRLRWLIDGHAAWIFAELKVRALSGAIMATLTVFCGEERREKTTRRIMAHLDPNLWQMFRLRPLDPGGAFFYGFNLMLPNVPGSRSLVRWIHEQAGVLEARIDFFEEMITPPEPFDEYVRNSRVGSADAAALFG